MSEFNEFNVKLTSRRINVTYKPYFEVEYLLKHLGGYLDINNGEAWLVLESKDLV